MPRKYYLDSDFLDLEFSFEYTVFTEFSDRVEANKHYKYAAPVTSADVVLFFESFETLLNRWVYAAFEAEVIKNHGDSLAEFRRDFQTHSLVKLQVEQLAVGSIKGRIRALLDPKWLAKFGVDLVKHYLVELAVVATFMVILPEHRITHAHAEADKASRSRIEQVAQHPVATGAIIDFVSRLSLDPYSNQYRSWSLKIENSKTGGVMLDGTSPKEIKIRDLSSLRKDKPVPPRTRRRRSNH